MAYLIIFVTGGVFCLPILLFNVFYISMRLTLVANLIEFGCRLQ